MRGANRGAAYFLGVMLFLASALHSAGLASKPAALVPAEFSKWSCFTGYLAHQGKSDLVAYRDSEQILRDVLSFRTLQAPCCSGKMNIVGVVKVEVVIDRDGVLRCARAVSGNPIAMVSAIQSLPAWRFRPYRMRGRPATVIGFILLPFHFLSG